MRVPVPAVKRAVDVLSPVSRGTSTVAPNIANTCWKLKGIQRPSGGLSCGPNETELSFAMYNSYFLFPFLVQLLYALAEGRPADARVAVEARPVLEREPFLLHAAEHRIKVPAGEGNVLDRALCGGT